MADVSFEDVSKVYADGTRAVDGMDLAVKDGEFMVLVGPSGCGKTTALRMVAGLEDISAGDVRIGDRVVNHVPPRDRDIAMVFQSYALYPHLNVYDNIAFGLRLRKTPKDEIDRRGARSRRRPGPRGVPRPQAARSLRRAAPAGRHGPRHRAPSPGLPHGRAALQPGRQAARADARRDQPLQRRLGTTTIYVTHDQVEAMTMGDRVAVMRNGRAAASRPSAGALRPAGQPVRRRLHRQPGHEHGRGHDRTQGARPGRRHRHAAPGPGR